MSYQGLPVVFVRTNKEDVSVGWKFVDSNGDAVDMTATGREFKVEFYAKGTGSALATLDTAASPPTLTVSGTGDQISGYVAAATSNSWALGHISCDLIYYDGTNTNVLVPSVVDHVLPGRGAPEVTEVAQLTIDATTLGISPSGIVKLSGFTPASGGGISNVVEDTTPQLGGQLDVNGNAIGNGTLELLTFTETGSAVNHLNVTNAATGNGPTLGAAGDDANIDLNLAPKGTGDVVLGTLTFDGDQTVGAGQDNYVLTYDNGTGLIALEAAAGGGGTPGGSSGQIQYNNAGSFGGALLTYSAGQLQLGDADAASPVAQTLNVQSVVAGTTNTAGTDFTIKGSAGTGTGAGGDIIFQTAPSGGSGTTQNSFATAMTIDGDTGATYWGNTDGAFYVGSNASTPSLRAYVSGSNGGIQFGRDGVALGGTLYANNSTISLIGASASIANIVISSSNTGGDANGSTSVGVILGGGSQISNTASIVYGTNNPSAANTFYIFADANVSRNRNGSDLALVGGRGYDSGATDRDGGDVYIRGGVKANSGTDGLIHIGDSNTGGIGLFGATPVAQQTTTGTTTGFTAGSGTSANDDSTYTGNSGTAAYTVGDIVLALKNIGILAAS